MKSIRKEFSHGLIEWRNESGRLHREDGPAIEHQEGTREWWINGNRISFHIYDGWQLVHIRIR